MNQLKRFRSGGLKMLASISVVTATLSIGLAHAGEEGHSKTVDIGMKGDPASISQTVQIDMYDNYYEPEDLSFKEGQTVKFIITNKGDAVHEFNIGTAEQHIAHQPEMEMMFEHGVLEVDRINWDAAKAMQASMGHGMHAEANSILLEPGETGEIIWTFPEHAELEFACNIPGHYDSGMVGEVELTH